MHNMGRACLDHLLPGLSLSISVRFPTRQPSVPSRTTMSNFRLAQVPCQSGCRLSSTRSRWSQHCQTFAQAAPVEAAETIADGLMELDLKVEGMTCGHCVSRVTEALQEHDVVSSASVSLETGLATVTVRAENQMDALEHLPRLVDLVNELGFPAQPHFGELD